MILYAALLAFSVLEQPCNVWERHRLLSPCATGPACESMTEPLGYQSVIRAGGCVTPDANPGQVVYWECLTCL